MDADIPFYWSEDRRQYGDGPLVDHERPGAPKSGADVGMFPRNYPNATCIHVVLPVCVVRATLM